MKILNYIKLVSEEEIARRYFIMNSFDGALTILGVLVGMYTAGVSDSRVVIIACLGAAVAMAVSGVWGAYATERAERMRELKRLGQYMLKDLEETRIGRTAEKMSFIIAFVDGMSPLLVSVLLVTPFLASHLGLLSIDAAYYSSAVMVMFVLFLLGVIVGKIGKNSVIKSGLRMVLAGVLVGLIVIALDLMKFV